MLFAAHLGRPVSPSTIKVYLAAVSLSHRQAGLSSLPRHNPALRLALRGLTRRQAGAIRHMRAPITKLKSVGMTLAKVKERNKME